MTFLKKITRPKLALPALIAIALLFVGSTGFAHADVESKIVGIAYDAIGGICEIIGYILAAIVGIFIALEAWLIGVVMNINSGILNTPLVQTGFSITLSVANLAFVLGIIVIAIATILRNNTYGVKQLLWKLVVMAILVNFGLVIMAPIFALGNSFTVYFLNCINPVSGGCTPTGGFTESAASFNNFAMSLSTAFGPQVSLTGLNSKVQSTDTSLSSAFSSGAKWGADIGSLIVPIFGIFFTAINLILIAFVLAVFLAMMTIRYLYIAILAILLPFAWAAWVFPSFSHHFKGWWDQFIRWTFFSPIVMFFIYLAILSMKSTGGVLDPNTYTATANTGGQSGVWAAISGFVGGLLTPVISSFLTEILLGGLIIGGMIAADKMGIKMANTVTKSVSAVGNKVKSYATDQSKKAGRAAFRKAGGEKAVNAMREGRLGGLQKVPGLGWAASRVASNAGRAIQSRLSNSDLVEKEKKSVSEDTKVVEQNLKGNMNMEATLAHIAKLIEKGKLRENTMVGNMKVGEWMDAHENDVANYGFAKNANDANLAIGSNKEMRTATNDEDRQKASDKFIAGLEKTDVAKMNHNSIFNEHPDESKGEELNAFRENLIRSFTTVGPHLASGAIAKMKSSVKDDFATAYDKTIESEKGSSPNIKAKEDAEREIKDLEKQKTADPAIKKLKEEIEKVKAGGGFDADKQEEIKKLTDQISTITDQIDGKIEAAQTKKETAVNSFTKLEKNILFAEKVFKTSLEANATYGAEPAPQTPH